MRKVAKPSRILDFLHRGFVATCVGITAFGLFIGGTRIYHYIAVTKPKKALAQEEFLKEPPRPKVQGFEGADQIPLPPQSSSDPLFEEETLTLTVEPTNLTD